MEFSKKLALFVSMVFAVVILLSCYIFLRHDRVSLDLLSAVGTPFSIVVTGYFAKAGVENFSKINKSE